MKTLFRIALAVFMVVVLFSLASAQIIQITVPLSGAQEVPPVATAATGTGTLLVDTVARTISGSATFSGLSSAAQGAHIHVGAAGVNGDVLIPMTGGDGVTAGTYSFPQTVLTVPNFNILTSNGMYINVHSLNNPGGEIRGQIIFPSLSSGRIRWREVHGIIEPGNLVGSGATGTVTGGGQPWTTTPLHGRPVNGNFVVLNVNNGKLSFAVRGLVLAGGNNVGTAGGVTEVRGTLVCDTDGSATAGNSVLVDTPLVPLNSRGDAIFVGTVTLDGVCLSEPDIAFLIRTSGGNWIANGAVRIP
jgi:hypothetical protein